MLFYFLAFLALMSLLTVIVIPLFLLSVDLALYFYRRFYNFIYPPKKINIFKKRPRGSVVGNALRAYAKSL